MSGSYDHGQLKGAFKAGYDSGFNDGRESLRAEGWEPIKSWSDLKIGDSVKLMVPTAFGNWKGIGIVTLFGPDFVHLQRSDYPHDDPNGEVQACLHECLVLRLREEPT